MLTTFTFHQQLSSANSLQINPQLHSNTLIWRRRNSLVIRCCLNKQGENKNYYEVLGVPVDSSPREIKDAYRKLQKKYHPDIAGEKGHESTLMLNKAYKVLMRDDLRKEYDSTIGRISFAVGRGAFGSTWNGPLRPQALFVDENSCIGCRECVHQAGNTFVMDEAFGTARVKVQFGVDDETIKVSVDSCPVNCIHWVDTQDLEALEYLIQPQPKAGNGVYGQGWDRPKNVFMAAKSFNKQQRHANGSSVDEETRAQAQARESAYKELEVGSFARIWSWMKKITGK